MRHLTSLSIVWALASFLACPGSAFGDAPERSVYSRVTSDAANVVATPPAELRDFWGGIKGEWLAEDGWRNVGSYCYQYAKDHPDVIRDIMKDHLGESEAKEMIYSMVISGLDQEKSMPLLKFYASHGTDQQKSMANDYIADIEETNRHAAFPDGDEYPDNRLPVTNSPEELREFWKGIDKQWIDTWAKTELLNGYCLKYAQAHPEGSRLRFVFEDLVAHPSEVRDVVYSRLVLVMNPDQTKPILTAYSLHGTAREKLIANDFLMLVDSKGTSIKK